MISGLFLYPSQVGGAEKFFYNLLDGIKESELFKSTKLVMNPDVMDEVDPIVKDYEIIFESEEEAEEWETEIQEVLNG